MHFNGLIMRWRLQAIGGLAGLVTAAGFIVANVDDPGMRYRAMLLLAMTLTCGWIGVAYIDLKYYSQLLYGAVEALLRLERKVPDVQMSTLIERHAWRGGRRGPLVFYGMGLLPLVVITSWAAYNLIAAR